MLAGADGLISVGSNALPRTFRRLCDLARAGRADAVAALDAQLQEIYGFLGVESNPIPVKAALAMMGRIRNVLRLPLVPAQPATTARLRQELGRLNVRLTQ